MNELYNILWIVFYSVAIFTPFFILGGVQRHGPDKKSGTVVGLLLAIIYIIFGISFLVLIFASVGFFSGRFLDLDKRWFRSAFSFGLIVAFLDTFWPSRLVFFSPLTVNRPTLMSLLIGIFGQEEYHRGGSLYGMGRIVFEQEVTLFGKYPILAGYPDAVGAPRVEVQIIISLIMLCLIFLVVWSIMKFIKRGTKPRALFFAGCIFGFTLLPIQGFILFALICSGLIGKYAYKVDLVPVFLKSLSFSEMFVIVAGYTVLYHLVFAEGIIDGFGWHTIDWGMIYATIGVFSMLLGPVIAQSAQNKYKL